MGLLDWLTDSFGGAGGGAAMMGGGIGMPESITQAKMPPPGMPPVQPMDTASSMPPPSRMRNDPAAMSKQGGTMPLPPTAFAEPPPSYGPGAGAMPEQTYSQGMPPIGPGAGAMPEEVYKQGDPMKMPPMAAPGPGAVPPTAAPAQHQMPGAPMNITPDAAQLDKADPNNIRGALGLTRSEGMNLGRKIGSSLSAGLKAAGDSAGKSPAQAAFGGAGAAMEGGQKRDDKTHAEQQQYLQRAIAAKQAGNTADYNTNYLKYLTLKAQNDLELQKTKAAAGGKDSVMNSQPQLYLRGLTAVSQDPNVKAAAHRVREAEKFGANSKQAKLAREEHDALVKTTRENVFKQLGVDGKEAEKFGRQPGFSRENPVAVKGKTQAEIDALPEGSWIVSPEGKVLMKTPKPAVAGAGAVPNLPMSPASPGPAPARMAMASASSDEDDE